MNWTGACLCNAVAFSCSGRARMAHECHCTQCRRWSGHVWGFVQMQWDAIRFTRQDGLRWYRHTPRATRGFCEVCGSTLFFREDKGTSVDVSVGALDAPTGLMLGAPSFARFHGDYYQPGGIR